MDPGSKLPVTRRRPHAELGRDNGADSATGTGTAPTVSGLRPSTPPWPRGGRTRAVLRLRPRWTLRPGHSSERALREESAGRKPGESKVGKPEGGVEVGLRDIKARPLGGIF